MTVHPVSTGCRSASVVERRAYRFGFVMEQTLGHVTHYRNLRATVDAEAGVDASWYPLSFESESRIDRWPVLRSNWSARASLRARREIGSARAVRRHDTLFFHTQVTTLLARAVMRRIPSVISLDATPINYDSVGAAYGHQLGWSAAERVKRQLNRRSLQAAAALVTWCDWARQSLIRDYGIQAERVTVVPPGVDLTLWPHPAVREAGGRIRLLFVGGDFERKGGNILLQAHAALEGRCELHVVTKQPIAPAPGLFVYRDVAPNSELLQHLYATADIFVLPTLADCFPLVVQEAMATGLPVVATDVGAIGEAVRHGETGLLVPANDGDMLRNALDLLVKDEEMRRRMGVRGRGVAEELFDSAANARRILGIMRCLADQPWRNAQATAHMNGKRQ